MKKIAVSLSICVALAACTTGLERNTAGHPSIARVGEERPVASPRAPLSLPDLVRMEKAGKPTAEIVARLRSTGQKIAFDGPAQARLRELGASETLLQALREAEAQARETDRITAEVDRAADRKIRERREYVLSPYYDYAYPYPYTYPSYTYPYSYYPYWGRFHPYIGYQWGGHYGGWGSGIYWSW